MAQIQHPLQISQQPNHGIRIITIKMDALVGIVSIVTLLAAFSIFRGDYSNSSIILVPDLQICKIELVVFQMGKG